MIAPRPRLDLGWLARILKGVARTAAAPIISKLEAAGCLAGLQAGSLSGLAGAFGLLDKLTEDRR